MLYLIYCQFQNHSMTTLYDVLGLSRQADAAQVEHGYRIMMAALTSDGGDVRYQQDMIRAKAIREAHAILSSPARRSAYDEKLRIKERINYEVVATPDTPWMKFAVLGVIVVLCLGYYKIRTRQMEVERVALEAGRAAVEADKAARLAEAEDARLVQQVLYDKKQAEQTRMRETEQARRDGQQIHNDLLRAEAQEAREKEQATRRAKMEQQQEEQAALNRSRNQISGMQRALSIPIVRH
jgi:curved DNA-binding protein CbpA